MSCPICKVRHPDICWALRVDRSSTGGTLTTHWGGLSVVLLHIVSCITFLNYVHLIYLLDVFQNKINHSVIKDLLDPIKELYEDVRRKALMRLEYEGLHKSEAITTPGARFHSDPAGFAMNRYAYYVCYKCKKVWRSRPREAEARRLCFICIASRSRSPVPFRLTVARLVLYELL